MPTFVKTALQEQGITLDDKCVIEYNHRKIQAFKRGWYNQGGYAKWKYDEEKYWRALVPVLYINEVTQMNLRATCIAAKELIRLFRVEKLSNKEIINLAEKVGQRVLLSRQNDTEEYYKALIPDSLSPRAKKFKYNKRVIDIAEQAFRFRVDRERIPTKLDKIIIDALIDNVWYECNTDDEIVEALAKNWKITISREKFYTWRRENKPNEHKQHKQHKQHVKSDKQKAIELNRVKENARTIVNLKKEYGEDWKKHLTKAEENYCRRHKDDTEYYVAYYTDVLTVAEQVEKYRQVYGVYKWLDFVDDSWKKAYFDMEKDVEDVISNGMVLSY